MEYGVDSVLLRKIIKFKYDSIENYAKAFGISSQAMYKQINGDTEITSKLLKKHVEMLGLADRPVQEICELFICR